MSTTKILVADKDPKVIREIALALRPKGYSTVIASDAISAVSVALRESPALAIIDLNLPGGYGLVVMERLRSLPSAAHVPVIIISAEDPASNKWRSLNAGAEGFLKKPLDTGELMNTLRDVLGETQGNGEQESLLSFEAGAAGTEDPLTEESQLERALFDPETSLYNRTGFVTLARQQLKLAERSKRPTLLLSISISGFEDISASSGQGRDF